jgi:hypothetical protein
LDIAHRLRGLGLEQYAPALAANDIDRSEDPKEPLDEVA